MNNISFSPFFWISPPPFYKSLQFYNNSSTHFSRNAAKQVKQRRFCANVAAIPPLSFSVSSSILQIPIILKVIYQFNIYGNVRWD